MTPENHVSRTVCVSTNVGTIEQAFAFVITHMDAERLAHPHIEISPCWHYTTEPDEPPELSFSVQIQGEQARQ